MTNEEILKPVLEAEGFKIITCEDMSLAEQVATFAEAQYVIGPHGAGLMNTMFCPASCRVVEISAPCNNLCFWFLCRQLGLRYQRWTIGIAEHEHDDIELDAKRFSEVLEESREEWLKGCPVWHSN